jgi:hypothetical protein
MARGDHSDWDISIPIDHTKIGDVPAEICDVKSSAKIIIAKEHIEPGASQSGGQHLKGSTRVYIDSAIPSLDPEGNNLDTSSTTDDGRFAIATADSNTLKVYIATSAGVSTGFEAVRVERVNSQNIVGIATGTQSGQAIHVGQIDTTAATGQLTLFEPATTADIRVSVLDPPTGNTHIASKKYVDAQLSGAVPDDDAFGTWASKSDSTTYEAASDGFVVAMVTSGSSTLFGYTSDSETDVGNEESSTMRQAAQPGQNNFDNSILMPVKKGDFWRVVDSDTVYWLPVGA